MLINKATEPRAKIKDLKIRFHLRGRTNGDILLSGGAYQLLKQPNYIEVFHLKKEARLFVRAGQNPDAGHPVRIKSSGDFFFPCYVVYRTFLMGRKRVKLSSKPTRIDGLDWYEVLWQDDYQDEKPPAEPTLSKALERRLDQTTAAAMELAEWVVLARPQSVFKGAEISAEARATLRDFFAQADKN
jgi:hypothetical protein